MDLLTGWKIIIIFDFRFVYMRELKQTQRTYMYLVTSPVW